MGVKGEGVIDGENEDWDSYEVVWEGVSIVYKCEKY